MFGYTGEEDLLRQAKGMTQLAANGLYPQPDTASGVPVAHAGVTPFGINVFLNEEEAGTCWEELGSLGIESPAADRDIHEHEVLLSWEHTPIHVFFSYDPFHESCRVRARQVPFADGEIWILSAEDITIFKVIYDRPKDRAEVREVLLCMGERFDVAYAIGWLERILGSGDARVTRFREAVTELVPS